MRTETIVLAEALDILAAEIICEDGVATAAISEAAHRLRELHRTNGRLDGLVAMRDARISDFRRALSDAISTYNPNRETTFVSAERQEAWIATLNGKP